MVPIIASVHVADDGAVSATVDTDGDNLTELAGYLLDHMLDEASRTALATWLALRTEDAEDAGDDV